MKIKCLFLTALLLAFTTVGFAQAKKSTAAIAPEQVVKNLYAAQKLEKTNPFAQIKSRALVDQYFTKDFAELVWKTNSSELGWNVDPLYNSQDPQITNFVVGTPKEDGDADNLYLKVNFKSYGKAESVGFNLRREANKTWKIANIDYSDGEDLASILRYSTDAEFQKLYDDDQTFKGGYTIGATLCDVVPTMNGQFYRVTCDGQENFKLYAVEGDEKQTAFIYTDGKGKAIDKFVFKNGENDGKFFDAAGKEVQVKRVQAAEDGKTSETAMPAGDSENVSGELQIGKTTSVILYVGEETGDYAAYCFKNDSEAGRAILAACKNGEQCEVKATLGDTEADCKVPGLEANLSASFNLVKVASAKSLGRRK